MSSERRGRRVIVTGRQGWCCMVGILPTSSSTRRYYYLLLVNTNSTRRLYETANAWIPLLNTSSTSTVLQYVAGWLVRLSPTPISMSPTHTSRAGIPLESHPVPACRLDATQYSARDRDGSVPRPWLRFPSRHAIGGRIFASPFPPSVNNRSRDRQAPAPLVKLANMVPVHAVP